MSDLDARVARSDGTVGEAIPGDFLVLDLGTGRYFGLGEVGGFIWALLDGERDLHEVAAAVADRYGVEVERAATDAAELVAELLGRGLVRVVECCGSTGAAPPG